MKRKYLYPMTLPFCLLFTTAQAHNLAPQPQICPSAASIQAIGVSHKMVQESNSLWFTGRRDQFYDTHSRWTFVIGKIAATSVDDAYQKAVLNLNSLTFQMGPVEGPVGKWVCYYHANYGADAVAVNPPIARNLDQSFLKH